MRRWAGDAFGHVAVIQMGQLVSALAYALMGPLPPLARVLDKPYQRPLFWSALAALGLGSGSNFVPVLPAMLEYIGEVIYAPRLSVVFPW
jgi:hypothetical protein